MGRGGRPTTAAGGRERRPCAWTHWPQVFRGRDKVPRPAVRRRTSRNTDGTHGPVERDPAIADHHFRARARGAEVYTVGGRNVRGSQNARIDTAVPIKLSPYSIYVHFSVLSVIQRTAMYIGTLFNRAHTHTHTRTVTVNGRTCVRSHTHTHTHKRRCCVRSFLGRKTRMGVGKNESLTGRTRRRRRTLRIVAGRRREFVRLGGVYYRVKIAKRYGTAEQ